MIREFTGSGERLDVLLSADGELSRSRAAALIKDGCVSVGERVENKPSYKTEPGELIYLDMPEVKPAKAEAQDIPLEILYQDAHLAVVVKPCGMVVHPAAGNDDGTLVNALLYHLDSLSGIGGEMRPGIVHRLDKDTSGLMLVAKDDATHAALSEQLSERQMEKHYRAMVYGKMKELSGVIEKPIGRSKTDRKKMAVDENGRWAKTEWKVLKEYPDRTLLDVHIITGRTHQIRVHMASIGHPVLGDVLYGHKRMPAVERLMLHAYSLEFTHPQTGERMRFTAKCPFCEQ
ncbi:MAG: RluA family pseudouridine synthase [Clostridia bacterium]|nr:RluA family pseudouridine synthase [Clostridia bacterium]MBR0407658.1 RluA family pseudouridine synthase [Clostridia bacterium]